MGPFLERGFSFGANSRTGYIKIGPFLERGINFRGIFFLERHANLESRAAHTHPKNTQVPHPPGGSHTCSYKAGYGGNGKQCCGKNGFKEIQKKD